MVTRPNTLDFTLLGLSRAGVSVASAFRRAGHRLRGVWNRTPRTHGFGDDVLTWTKPSECVGGSRVGDEIEIDGDAPGASIDLVIVAVSDDAIVDVVADLVASVDFREFAAPPLVVHLSGSRSLDVLDAVAQRGGAVGALHPLRSFPAPIHDGSGLDGVPCAVEADEPHRSRLIAATQTTGGKPFVVADGEAKVAYHLAASVASNFAVTLAALAERQLERAGITDEAVRRGLVRLAVETLENVGERGPAGALTGPIIRGDADVVARHLAALADAPTERGLYEALATATLDLAREAAPERRVAHDAVARILGVESSNNNRDKDAASEPGADDRG